MQVSCYYQHFGRFALGMSCIDQLIEDVQGTLDQSESDHFFQVERGGLGGHAMVPHTMKWDTLLAIVGEGFIDNQDAEQALYARLVEGQDGEPSNTYYVCLSLPVRHLPNPIKLADDILARSDEDLKTPRILKWYPLDYEHNVPAHIRRQLDKVVKRIQTNIVQAPDFFGKRRR